MADEKDAKLAAALRQAKTNPMFFAFVAKGATDGVLMVGKKKIPAKEVNEAKTESGGKKVFRGRCQGEDGKMVFELGKEPPGGLAKQLKAVIHASAGLMLQVETRLAADLAEEESGEESEAQGEESEMPAAPPPQTGGADVVNRLNALSASIKTALAGPNKAKVVPLFGSVNNSIKANDFAAASKTLDELEALLKKPVPTAPPPPPSESGGAVVMKRLNALSNDIKKAMAGPHKARVQALFVAVNGQIKGEDFAQASKTLDELEALLKAPPPPTTSTTPPPKDESALHDEWERRVVALEPRVLEAQKKRAGEAKWMTLFMSVQDLGGAGDYAKALALLDRLEGMLNAPPPTNAGLETALGQWTAARGKVIETLATLEKHIRAMDDPDGNAAIILVRAIQANLTPRPETARDVAELENYITTDQIIGEAEGPNGFGLDVAIRAPLLPALAAVRAAVA